MLFHQPHLFVVSRRRSKFHGLTFVAVMAILIAQAILLVGLMAFWRSDSQPLIEDEPAVLPALPKPVKSSDPTEVPIEEAPPLPEPPVAVERVRPDWLTGRETPETGPADRFVSPEE